jgi:alkanesulfonate monooxygenase SsuD/methylene tetrahydromethanopterin reductase-like flavin-dependent oxidoreductase (luciferase family)
VAVDLSDAHGSAVPAHVGRAIRHDGGGERNVAAAGGSTPPELPAVAEDLAQDVALFGTYDQAGATIAGWFAAGIDSLNLVLPHGHPEEELAEFLDVASRAVSAEPVQPPS